MSPAEARAKCVEHARRADEHMRADEYFVANFHNEWSRVFARMAVRLENDPDCSATILPDDASKADAAATPPGSVGTNSIPDEYEMPGRPFE